MKLIPFELDGREYHLLFNGAALFDVYDQFGAEGSILDPIKGNGREDFEAVCWYLEELATQGELYRRHQGYDPLPVPTAELFETVLSPLDVPLARAAIHAAIAAGFDREEGKPREIDKGLLELEKKTGAGSPAPST